MEPNPITSAETATTTNVLKVVNMLIWLCTNNPHINRIQWAYIYFDEDPCDNLFSGNDT